MHGPTCIFWANVTPFSPQVLAMAAGALAALPVLVLAERRAVNPVCVCLNVLEPYPPEFYDNPYRIC
jgi:hypothetical protein